jgi:prepilin-type N-terminal cleavage/methylation domain-containing protein
MRQLIKDIKKSAQNGFTILEILIATAITGVLVAGATGVIFQMYSVNKKAIESTQAIEQVENVSRWMNQDALMAQIDRLVPAQVFPLF